MADSVLVDKKFLEALKPTICCDEKVVSCRIDPFCASDPEAWPSVENEKQTQLAHPEKNSVPGTSYFCFAYMDWDKTMLVGNKRSNKPFPKSILNLYKSGAEQFVYYAKTKGAGAGHDMDRLEKFCENLNAAKERREEQPNQSSKNEKNKNKVVSLIHYAIVALAFIISIYTGYVTYAVRRWANEIGGHLSWWEAFKITMKDIYIADVLNSIENLILKIGRKLTQAAVVSEKVPESKEPVLGSSFPRPKLNPDFQASSPPLSSEIAPAASESPDVEQIIAEHLQKQPDPWNLIFDEAHFNEVLNQSHGVLYFLQEESPQLRDQPLFVQLYIEDMAIKEWDEKASFSQKGKPDKSFRLEFANRYLRHDLDVYRGSATEWVKEIWYLNGDGIYKEFGMKSVSHELPSVIMDLLNRVPPHGTVINPLEIIKRTKEYSWMIESHKDEFYRGINFHRIIYSLAMKNNQLERYPFGEMEARFVIESWDALSDENKMLITTQAAKERNDRSIYAPDQIIPDFYIRAWHDRFIQLAKERQAKNSGSSTPAGGVVEGMEILEEDSSKPKPVARRMHTQTPQMVRGLQYYLNRTRAVFSPMTAPLGLRPVPVGH